MASEVKCLRVIERRDLSNEQNTFKSKTIFYHNKTRLKPERATRPIPKRRRPLYATATRPIPKRRRPLYATATRPIPKRRRPLYATATRPIPKRRRPLYATATTQILNLSNLLKGSDIKRTSRRTALLKGRNTRTIQAAIKASERDRYWNDPAVRLSKRAAERKRSPNYHYHPKVCHGMLYCTCIIKLLEDVHATCVQHACKGSAQNHSLHM